MINEYRIRLIPKPIKLRKFSEFFCFEKVLFLSESHTKLHLNNEFIKESSISK